MAEHDLVITGGTVLDGTGTEPFRADIGITGGIITGLGAAGALSGRATLPADDGVVCPGFIDLHSHADFTIQGHPAADASVMQGVTTLGTGNCGWSPFPTDDSSRLRAASAFLDPELDWSWTDVDGYASAIDQSRPAVNVALQVGHSALRLAVLGSEERESTSDELDRMCALLERAAKQGAFGFSTGLIYAPGCYADAEEVTALAAVAARHDLLYSTHIRNESDHVVEAVAEAIATARTSGVRLEISHLKAMGPANHGKVHESLRMLDAARAEGLRVSADVYPYTASSTTLTSRLPAWAMDGGVPALLDRLADPGARAGIARELRERMGRDIDPEGVVLADLPVGRFSGAVGSSLADVARELGVDAADAAMEVLGAHDGVVAVVNHAMAEEDVAAVLAHPQVSVASDGWVLRPTGGGRPHPRSFGTFPRVLGRYVRERNVLSLADAVRKMTSLPATQLGLGDRGRLAAGMVADICVFDPAEVRDTATYDDPWSLAAGIDHVLVAGEAIVRDGTMTGSRPGRVLRKR